MSIRICSVIVLLALALNDYAWTASALNALESLGAREIRRYCYRNSYALITIKGRGMVAEHLTNGTRATARFVLTAE